MRMRAVAAYPAMGERVGKHAPDACIYKAFVTQANAERLDGVCHLATVEPTERLQFCWGQYRVHWYVSPP